MREKKKYEEKLKVPGEKNQKGKRARIKVDQLYTLIVVRWIRIYPNKTDFLTSNLHWP